MSLASLSPCDEAAILAIPAGCPCRPAARPWILATTILASGMVFIDGTVVNVALPALQKEFDASVGEVQWVVESYALLLTALLLLGGSAGDRFGRRRVFAIGVAVFGVASACCGLAGTIGALIWARAAQGVGGALLVPGSLALISASFPQSIRGKAIGTWSGYTAITAALGCLVYGLIGSSSLGWGDVRVIGTLALAPLAFTAFVVVEKRHPSPMLPLRLFRSRNFSGANVLTLLLYAALGGSLFFLPLNLIQVQGYSATAAGAALLPFILIMFVLSPWAGGLVDRYGSRGPLVVGPAIAGLGFALFAVPGIGGSYWTTFFPAVLVLGFGMTITVAPLTTTVMNALDRTLAGAASGVNNAVSRAAALLAIAVLGIVMSLAFDHALAQRTRAWPVSPPVSAQVEAQRGRLAAIDVPPAATEGERQAIKTAVGGAFVYGFRWVMLVAALLAMASSLSAWLTVGETRNESAKR